MSVGAGGMACRGVDPEVFFGPADSGEGGQPYRWEWRALEVCWSCPVVAVCLREALEWPAEDQHGVIGGMTAGQRRAALRSLRWRPVHRLAASRGGDELSVEHLAAGRRLSGACGVDVVGAAVRLRQAGHEVASIARRLGASDRSVYRWLARTGAAA